MSIKTYGWKWFRSDVNKKMVLTRKDGSIITSLKYDTLDDLIESGVAASIPQDYDFLFDAIAEYENPKRPSTKDVAVQGNSDNETA